jgi:hypothetical protein
MFFLYRGVQYNMRHVLSFDNSIDTRGKCEIEIVGSGDSIALIRDKTLPRLDFYVRFVNNESLHVEMPNKLKSRDSWEQWEKIIKNIHLKLSNYACE